MSPPRGSSASSGRSFIRLRVGFTGARPPALGCREGKQRLALPPGRGPVGPREAACPGDPGGTAPAEPCLSSDVDECRVLAHLCPHGECINSLGSFRCHCRAGYTPDATATACVGEPPAPPPEPLHAAPGTHPREKTETRSKASLFLPSTPSPYGPLSSCYLLHPKIFQSRCVAGVHLSQGRQIPARGLSPALRLFLLIKFYWHTATPICFLTLCGCFPATEAALSSWD